MDGIFQLNLQTESLISLHNMSSNQTQPTLLVQNPEKQLIEICNEYLDVFTPGSEKCSKISARLYLKKNAIPVYKKARPIPLALRGKVREELDRLINNGVLEEVDHSEWAAPCVLVRKPNGNIRICGDFSTGLNQALEVQKFPLPTHDELFSKIGGGEKFTTLDLTDAYLSIPMEEESKNLLVINTPFGLMRYNRLPFGIAPATAIFQRRMHTMLDGLQDVAFLLDDVIVTGKDDESHLKTLREVLQRIKDNGFCLNRSKCKFMQDNVSYLGLSVSKEGISTNLDKVQSILNMSEPKDIKQLETFLGMANFYSRFISRFSDILAPLNALRKKGTAWLWSNECSEAVTKIKQALASAPVLVPFDNTLPIVVAADASSVGAGGAIFHRYPDGTDRPIAYCSKTLTSAERNYSQIEREALAIIYTLKKFRIYLWGTEFLLQTDHRPLLSIFGSSKGIPSTTSCRLQRWALYLTHFTFKIEYVSTTKFAKVDCLSRIPLGEDQDFEEADESYDTVVNLIFSGSMSSLPITSKEVSEETDKDIVLKKVKNYIVNGWPDDNTDPELKAFKTKKHELTLHDGCIIWGVRVAIPTTLRNKVLENLHDTHLGMVKMKSLAREYIWWPGIDKSIELISQSCSLCNTFSPKEPQKKYLVSWPHCKAPWSRIHVDFAGPFLNKTFLLVIDAFSGWTEIIMMNSTTTAATVKQLKLLICRYGIPTTIVSDNGSCFTSSDFADFCKQLNINHVRTPVNHPSSNGQVEKYVGTMKNSLRKLHQEVSPKGLEADLNNFLFKYRLTPHVKTGVSPAELFLGRQLRCQFDSIRPVGNEEETPETRTSENQIKNFDIGQPIYWSEMRNGKVRWNCGKVIKRLGRNVWKVEAGGQVFTKHADQLRKRV